MTSWYVIVQEAKNTFLEPETSILLIMVSIGWWTTSLNRKCLEKITKDPSIHLELVTLGFQVVHDGSTWWQSTLKRASHVVGQEVAIEKNTPQTHEIYNQQLTVFNLEVVCVFLKNKQGNSYYTHNVGPY